MRKVASGTCKTSNDRSPCGLARSNHRIRDWEKSLGRTAAEDAVFVIIDGKVDSAGYISYTLAEIIALCLGWPGRPHN